jgi:tetratricopeptide (TPR) repeat protein
MGLLAQLLVSRGKFEEAEELARRSLDVLRAAAPGSNEMAEHEYWLGYVLGQENKEAEAEEPLRAALELLTRHFGADHPKRLTCANDLAVVLTSLGKLDEAEEILEDVAERRRTLLGDKSPEFALTLHAMANVARARGELDGAVELFDEAIAIFTPLPGERGRLVNSLESCAVVLRQMGETERAAEMQQRAQAVGR